MLMILHRRDCQGLDPRVVAQMVEPRFTDRDLLVILNTEDSSGPQPQPPQQSDAVVHATDCASTGVNSKCPTTLVGSYACHAVAGSNGQ